MKLWHIHPSYLDKELIDQLWEDGLKMQDAIINYTYDNGHKEVLDHENPTAFIGMYLTGVVRAAHANHDYDHDFSKIMDIQPTLPLPVSKALLYEEWCELQEELQERNPGKMQLNDAEDVNAIKAHSMFYVMEE
jgi:hypothetical protein